jgi:hypothetical protein
VFSVTKARKAYGLYAFSIGFLIAVVAGAVFNTALSRAARNPRHRYVKTQSVYAMLNTVCAIIGKDSGGLRTNDLLVLHGEISGIRRYL